MPDPTFNRYVASGIPDWLGYRIAVAFIWFWFSFMSFGVWAFVLGKFFHEGEVGEDAPPWQLEMYLGIPVAATFGGLVTFVLHRGGQLRRMG